MQTMVERLVMGGPLTTEERLERSTQKDVVVNRMVAQWLSDPEFLPYLLTWDANPMDWQQGASDEMLSEEIEQCDGRIWVDGEVQPNAKRDFVRGLILIRQRYRSLTDEEANAWNEQKRQIAELGGFYLSEEAMSRPGYPSRLLFISDLLRKLYHCYAGEVDFGGSVGRCGIRANLHHTMEWETQFTEKLRRGAPLSELLMTFTMEDLVNYGW